VFRRTLVGCLLTGIMLASGVSATAYARARVVKQQSNNAGTVYITAVSVVTNHRYRVDVSSPAGHQAFTGQALSHYIYVVNKQLYTAEKAINLSGTAPHSFTMRAQVPGRVSEWLLTIEVQLKRPHKVTVRIVDLGR